MALITLDIGRGREQLEVMHDTRIGYVISDYTVFWAGKNIIQNPTTKVSYYACETRADAYRKILEIHDGEPLPCPNRYHHFTKGGACRICGVLT